jgi:hypothetical protein
VKAFVVVAAVQFKNLHVGHGLVGKFFYFYFFLIYLQFIIGIFKKKSFNLFSFVFFCISKKKKKNNN